MAGIIISAVADEFVLAHPLGHTAMKTAIAVLGSAAIFLVGTMLFRWTITGRVPMLHLAGMGVVALLGFVVPYLPPVALALVATLVLLLIAIGERKARALSVESALERE
jgi:low temperature requirement protein LtrA